MRRLLVNSALPYANGSLHLGHMVEHIQADIWVRFQKLRGNICHFICGDDAHGTPIMLRAQQLGITPEELIKTVHAEHVQDFQDFAISFDNFYTTHSPENREFSHFIYEQLKKRGDIEVRTISQAYDPKESMFLPDRYVKGCCPKCGASDQYGDNCEACGATYNALDLKNPVSVISGATPIAKNSEHLFFNLHHYTEVLKRWVDSGHLPKPVVNKLDEWFETGLQAWDISRDAPYFGFSIPGYSDKYFYVWLDAPVGYMASCKNFCIKHPELSFDAMWNQDSEYELYHFIGKDIIYFHALFWPAMLMASGFRLPTAIFIHGFLTINGQKMSKSRGTFIKARTYLNHLPAEYLRYYFAAKLTRQLDDIDLNLEDFVQRVNTDLVGKMINIASRCARFINEYFDHELKLDSAQECPGAQLFHRVNAAHDKIIHDYESRDYSRVVRRVMDLADATNQFIDAEKPWIKIKDPNQRAEVHQVCSLGLAIFRVLIIYLKPVLPELSEKVEDFFQETNPLSFLSVGESLHGRRIKKFEPLAKRIEKEKVNAMLEEAKEEVKTTSQPVVDAVPSHQKSTIAIEDFAKVDLRVAKVLEAEAVEGADKLLKLKLEIGDGEIRQVFAGIKAFYEPEQLIGQHVVFVANLAPRKMRFGESQGMILAASFEGGRAFIVQPQEGAEAGMKVK